MICAGRSFSCFCLRCALEALFSACAADDLLALAKAETGLLDSKRLPQLLQAFVELSDLALYRGVETLGQAMPELLALLRELLDLSMDLVRCHVLVNASTRADIPRAQCAETSVVP
jgi:hypothetical protein